MYELLIQTHFAAAHRLREYAGNCERLHGHNWRIDVVLRAPALDSLGMVIDFRDAKRLIEDILRGYDHQYLNELDAFRELMLPQTTVLVGNHSTLWRWLLPEWSSDRSPTARDIAKAASEMGVPYTLVTGIPMPEQFIDNVLATPQAVLGSEKFERFEAIFSGAGDTLSAALAALVASGTDLVAASTEALAYLDRCLDAGFRPGMGNVVPDRLFWAQPEGEPEELTEEEAQALQVFDMPAHDTKH